MTSMPRRPGCYICDSINRAFLCPSCATQQAFDSQTGHIEPLRRQRDGLLQQLEQLLAQRVRLQSNWNPLLPFAAILSLLCRASLSLPGERQTFLAYFNSMQAQLRLGKHTYLRFADTHSTPTHKQNCNSTHWVPLMTLP